MSLLIHPKKERTWFTLHEKTPDFDRLLIIPYEGREVAALLTLRGSGHSVWKIVRTNLELPVRTFDSWSYL